VTAGSRAPLVTVLMAVHNGIRYIDEAIGSILRQTFSDFEFLIVDDGSTDGTYEHIRACDDARIRLVRNDANLGLTRSLNRGLALARGTLVARQDADDVSHTDRLAAQVACLEQEQSVAILGTQARMIDASGRPVRAAPWPKSTSDRAIRWQLIFDSPFVHASVMFRKDVVWSALGGYDETFTTSQDFELWSRVAAAGHAMKNLPGVHMSFRVHHASISSRYELKSVAKLRVVLQENLERAVGSSAAPAGWPDTWIRLNNPRLFPQSADSPAAIARAIESIHGQFESQRPDAPGDPEIRRHLAAMLIRVATSGAERGWMSSIAPFARGCRLDPAMGTLAASRYIARLAIGQWRGAAGRAERAADTR
jgi:glycosyltransferase involved in cell wall biosynthesis